MLIVMLYSVHHTSSPDFGIMPSEEAQILDFEMETLLLLETILSFAETTIYFVSFSK